MLHKALDRLSFRKIVQRVESGRQSRLESSSQVFPTEVETILRTAFLNEKSLNKSAIKKV